MGFFVYVYWSFWWVLLPIPSTSRLQGGLACIRQKSPIYMSKEPYLHVHRVLYTYPKNPIYIFKEPYIYIQRTLYTHSKSQIYVCKESNSPNPRVYKSVLWDFSYTYIGPSDGFFCTCTGLFSHKRDFYTRPNSPNPRVYKSLSWDFWYTYTGPSDGFFCTCIHDFFPIRETYILDPIHPISWLWDVGGWGRVPFSRI